MTAALSDNAATIRAHDPERFQATLFAPAERREALFALYAFDHELDRIRFSVTQPMTGLIRLQWWRDALDGIAAGRRPLAHPVVAGLAQHVWPALGEDWHHLQAAIDAREGEVETVAPFPDAAALAAYLEACGGITLAALTLLGGQEAGLRTAARDVGVALAVLRLLRALPADAGAGRLLLPARRVEDEGVDVHALVRGESAPGMATVVGEVRRVAEARLAAAREAARRVAPQALPAFLPATLAARRFASLRRAGDDPFGPALTRPAPLAPLTLLWHRMRGRY